MRQIVKVLIVKVLASIGSALCVFCAGDPARIWACPDWHFFPDISHLQVYPVRPDMLDVKDRLGNIDAAFTTSERTYCMVGHDGRVQCTGYSELYLPPGKHANPGECPYYRVSSTEYFWDSEKYCVPANEYNPEISLPDNHKITYGYAECGKLPGHILACIDHSEDDKFVLQPHNVWFYTTPTHY